MFCMSAGTIRDRAHIFILFFILRPARVVELTANRAAEALVRVCVCYRLPLSTCHTPDVAA